MSFKKLSEEEYSFLEIMEKFDSKDIKNMCLVNKSFNKLCDQYLNSIYRKLLKRDFSIDLPNNKVFQVLYDLVKGIKDDDKTNVYYTAFLYKNLNTEIIYNNRNIDKIINIIKFSQNPDMQDINGVTPLMLSIKFNKVKLFDEILKYNPNINIRDINDWNIIKYVIKNGENINMELFKKVLSLDLTLEEKEVYDIISILKGQYLRLFIDKYKKQMEKYNVLDYMLKFGDFENIEIIIKDFYKQFDIEKDLFGIIFDNENIELEQVESFIENLLKYNKINKKNYINKKIEDYIKQMSYDSLFSLLLIFKESIKINESYKEMPLVLYLLKHVNIEDIKNLFFIYDDININLKKDGISVFKYILKSNLDLWDIPENTKINYNDLIKDIDDKLDVYYLKKKLKDLETWIIQKGEPKFQTDLFNLLTIVFMILSLKMKIGNSDVIKKTLENFKDEKYINTKIDIKYWLSVV